jgi:hypothetical protein
LLLIRSYNAMAAAAPLVSEDSSRAAASAGGRGSGNDSSRADSRADTKAAATARYALF